MFHILLLLANNILCFYHYSETNLLERQKKFTYRIIDDLNRVYYSKTFSNKIADIVPEQSHYEIIKKIQNYLETIIRFTLKENNNESITCRNRHFIVLELTALHESLCDVIKQFYCFPTISFKTKHKLEQKLEELMDECHGEVFNRCLSSYTTDDYKSHGELSNVVYNFNLSDVKLIMPFI